MPRSGRRQLALLFAVALGLRLGYLHQLGATALGELLLGDGVAYDAWARRIVAGDWWGHEVFYQAPLYPYFLALVYALAGPSLFAVRVVQSILGAASCLLVARAGERWFGRREGLIAGWLVALYPPAIFFDGEIQKASLSLFLMSAILGLLGDLRAARPAPRALATGALAGLFALNRETALLLIPLLALWLALAPAQGERRRLLPAALLVAGAFAVLLPVALRNRALGGELLLTTSQLGTNFYLGNHAGADGRYHPLRPGRGSARYEREDATAIAEAGAGRALTPGEVSRYWLGRALDFVRAEPAAWLRLSVRKLFMVWSAREIVDTNSLEAAEDASWLLAALGRALDFGVLAPLAAAGIWLTRRRWHELALLYLLLAAWTLGVAAFFVFARYRFPMVPVLTLFAGAALAEGAAALRDRLPARLVPAAALAGVAAFAGRWPADGRDPRATTYANLGEALDDVGRTAEGARELERAVALSPTFAEAHRALGSLRLKQGDLEAAESAFLRAVELDPEDARAWNNLGVIAGRRGRVAQAVARFRRAVAADGRYAGALYNLGRTLLQAGDPSGARAAFERYTTLEPGDPEGREALRSLTALAPPKPVAPP